MKFYLAIYIYINICQLILTDQNIPLVGQLKFFGIFAGEEDPTLELKNISPENEGEINGIQSSSVCRESTHHDKSSLITAIGRKEQLEKCNIETTYGLPIQLFCGGCNDPAIQADFKNILDCTFKKLPDICQAVLDASNKPLTLCIKQLKDISLNVSINNPVEFKNGQECFNKHISQENLGRCNINLFYNSLANVFCEASCKDMVVQAGINSTLDCLTKQVPKIAKELLKFSKNKNANICVNQIKDYFVKLLLNDEVASNKAQDCSKMIAEQEQLNKCYVEQKFGPGFKIFCTGCRDPTVKVEFKNAIECMYKKIPENVEFFINASRSEPDECLNQITEYTSTVLAINNPAALQIATACYDTFIDQDKFKCC